MSMTTKNCNALIQDKKKTGLLKESQSRIGRVLKQNRIKDADNDVPRKKLVPKVPSATDIFVE